MSRTAPAGAPPLQVLGDGWLRPAAGVLHRRSPNQDARPPGTEASLLVLHNISLPPGVFGGEAIVDFFQNRLDVEAHPWFANIQALRVSAHFLIRRDGRVVQFVATTRRAWHAGVSRFRGRAQCNDYSLGIELEGTDADAYEDAQYARLTTLCQALRARHPGLRWVCGHEHVAPGRKTDPGPAFDWPRFVRATRWPRAATPLKPARAAARSGA